MEAELNSVVTHLAHSRWPFRLHATYDEPMMTALITVVTLTMVTILALWAVWPRLRAWIEQPKYDVLRQIRKHEDAHAETKPSG